METKLLKSILGFILIITLNFISAQASIMEGQLSSPSDIDELLKDKAPITAEFGFEYLHPDFAPINNVVVENPQTSTVSTPQYGNVVNTYPDVFAQTIKAQLLLDSKRKWTVTVKTFLPLNSLAQLDSGNTYQPEFVLYRAEMQRPRLSLLSGINLTDDWRVGLGAAIGFSIETQATVFLQSGTGRYSDQRIAAKLKPVIAPVGSVAFKDYTFTVKAENKSTFDLSTNAGARVFGSVGAGVNFAYATESTAYFEPWSFELNGKNRLSDSWNVLWGLSYELWSRYQARAAVIQSTVPTSCPDNAGTCTPVFNAGLTPAFQGRDLWVPELGFERLFGDIRIQLSYRYKDSIFKDVPTLNGNYLDPPRHDFKYTAIIPTISGLLWNFSIQVSRLVPQTVIKSNSGEIGATPDGSGYVASGWLYGGGLSLTIPLKQ